MEAIRKENSLLCEEIKNLKSLGRNSSRSSSSHVNYFIFSKTFPSFCDSFSGFSTGRHSRNKPVASKFFKGEIECVTGIMDWNFRNRLNKSD